MAAELTDQKNLSTVINYLRDTNATEELMLDEVVSHKDVLASKESKTFIHEVPILLEFIGEVLGDMMLLSKDIVKNGLQLIQNQRADAEEKRMDDNSSKKNKADNASSGVTFGDIRDKLGKGGWLSTLLATGAFLIGTIAGVIKQLALYIKVAFRETKIEKAVSKLTEFFSQKITSMMEFGKGLITKLEEVVTGTFTKLFSKETGIFKFVGEIAELIGKGVKFFGGGGGKSSILEAFSGLFEKMSFFFKIGKSFGATVTKLLGKIAVPLTIIIGIWDTIIGAIEGYKTEGILGTIKGGISGLLNSLVGSLLDLVKDGVSWLLEALGWEDAEKFLDSFSFSKLISDGVSAIVDGLAYYIEYLKGEFSLTKFEDAFKQFNVFGIFAILAGGILDTLKGALSWIFTIVGANDWANALDSFSFQDLYKKIFKSVKNTVNAIIDKVVAWFESIPDTMGDFAEKLGDIREQLIKSVLQNVLPRKDRNGAWYSPNNLAVAGIPARVYEYAGMNPDTGEVIKKVETSVSASVKDTAAGISSNPAAGGGTTIVNNNVSRGGDVNNVSNSNVNQNVNGAAGPIYTGSAMGLYSF